MILQGCVTRYMAIILDTVHHLKFFSNTIFQKLDLFPSSGVRKERVRI